ncbi:VOC family protein, partial [bacterium]|nr:VOC family protein [bacterium]
MKEATGHKPGSFCWAELVTTDGDSAKQFYTELFGWNFSDQPVGEGMVYTMLQLQDKNVAALYQMNQEQESRGIPPHWNSYISVANADESVAKTKSLGGTAHTDAFDVFDAGRMAQLQDPTGATFAVWQPNKHIGAMLVNQPGTLCWNELYTNDTQKAGDFYTRLFGWAANEQDMGEMATYTVFNNGDRMNGGMMQITEQMGPIPPNWMVYFAVHNCDDSVEK